MPGSGSRIVHPVHRIGRDEEGAQENRVTRSLLAGPVDKIAEDEEAGQLANGGDIGSLRSNVVLDAHWNDADSLALCVRPRLL